MPRLLSVLSLIVFLLPGVAERFHVHEPGHAAALHGTDASGVDVSEHICFLCKVIPSTLVAPTEGQHAPGLVRAGCTTASVLPALVAGTERCSPSLRGPPTVC